jgi:hypothetical protein
MVLQMKRGRGASDLVQAPDQGLGMAVVGGLTGQQAQPQQAQQARLCPHLRHVTAGAAHDVVNVIVNLLQVAEATVGVRGERGAAQGLSAGARLLPQ